METIRLPESALRRDVDSVLARTPLEHRLVRSLDFNWRFHLGDVVGAHASLFDDQAWRTLHVPHDWAIEGEIKADAPGGDANGFFPGGIGWYRRNLDVDGALEGKRVLLQFDGVHMNSDVWVNDHWLGRYPYGFSTFFYDVTEWLKPGQQNVLAVRVDNSTQPSARWYTGAGIYRHVWLIATDPLHIEPWGTTVTTPEVTPTHALVRIETRLGVGRYPETVFRWRDPTAADYKWVTKRCRVLSRIFTRDGDLVGEAATELDITNFSRQQVVQEIRLTQPQLWSPEQPALYRLHSVVHDGTRPVDDCTTTFGVRRLSFDPVQGFQVNDQPTKLKGCCLHQDAGALGRAVPEKVWRLRLGKMKELGANAIRCHGPVAPEFLDLCDEVGLFMLDDSFDEWEHDWEKSFAEGPRGKVEYGYNKFFQQWHETDLRTHIRRDRHHPSIVMWIVGNEIPEQYVQTAEAVATLRRLVAICHEEDPTRKTTVAIEGALPQPLNQEFITLVDVAGFNYIDLKNPEAYYSGYHARHPDRMMLGTESVYSLGNWLAVQDSSYVIGQFLWVGIDYLGEAVWPKHGWDRGLVDITGNAKPEYFFRQSLWSAKPMVHATVGEATISVNKITDIWNMPKVESHWNWPLGSTQPVLVYTNCEEVELFLNGRSLGIKRRADFPDLKLKWSVPYEPGELRAVAHRGAEVAESALRTAGAPAALRLSMETGDLMADGRDIGIATVEVVDRDGISVPQAAPVVSFVVSGAGTVLRTSSGDLGDAVPYTSASRRAFGGRCQVAFQAAPIPGRLVIEARAEGLDPASLSVESRTPAGARTSP